MERKKNKPKARQKKATSKPLRRTKKIKTPAESPDKNVLKAIKWTMENDPEIVSMKKKKMFWYLCSQISSRPEIVSLTDWELYHRILNETNWCSDDSLHVAFTFTQRMMRNYLLPVDCLRESYKTERDKTKRNKLVSSFLVRMQIRVPAGTGKKISYDPDKVRHFYNGLINGSTLPFCPENTVMMKLRPDLDWEKMEEDMKKIFPDRPPLSPEEAVKETSRHFEWGKNFKACATFLVDKCKLKNIPRFNYQKK